MSGRLSRRYGSGECQVWVRVPGLPLLPSLMDSVGEHRAQLRLEDPYIVPDQFDLLFSPIAQS
jgi:hypothetical protein